MTTIKRCVVSALGSSRYYRNRRLSLSLLSLAALTIGCLGGPKIEEPIATPSLSPIPRCQHEILNPDYSIAGPFTVDRMESEGARMWIPKSTSAGCRYPVVHFSHGTKALCTTYGSILEHLASWGFVSVCYQAKTTGSGKACLRGLNLALKAHESKIMPLVGSIGHSQGGGGAFACMALAEETSWHESFYFVGAGIQPAHGMALPRWRELYPKIKNPTFMFHGDRDWVVTPSWVGMGYGDIGGEKVWMEAVGATHFTSAKWTKEGVTPWLRWKLLGDDSARKYFKNLATTRYWRLIKESGGDR